VITKTPGFTRSWGLLYGEHNLGFVGSLADAITAAKTIVGWERNVRIVTPTGIKLTVQAARLLP